MEQAWILESIGSVSNPALYFITLTGQLPQSQFLETTFLYRMGVWNNSCLVIERTKWNVICAIHLATILPLIIVIPLFPIERKVRLIFYYSLLIEQSGFFTLFCLILINVYAALIKRLVSQRTKPVVHFTCITPLPPGDTESI